MGSARVREPNRFIREATYQHQRPAALAVHSHVAQHPPAICAPLPTPPYPLSMARRPLPCSRRRMEWCQWMGWPGWVWAGGVSGWREGWMDAGVVVCVPERALARKAPVQGTTQPAAAGSRGAEQKKESRDPPPGRPGQPIVGRHSLMQRVLEARLSDCSKIR